MVAPGNGKLYKKSKIVFEGRNPNDLKGFFQKDIVIDWIYSLWHE